MMEYKGYLAHLEFDDKEDLFHGEIINMRDVVTFQGGTVRQLRRAFQDSVADYLAFCAERGEEPAKPFSGRFVLRLDPELHRRIYLASRKEGKSLNAWVAQRLSKDLAQL